MDRGWQFPSRLLIAWLMEKRHADHSKTDHDGAFRSHGDLVDRRDFDFEEGLAELLPVQMVVFEIPLFGASSPYLKV